MDGSVHEMHDLFAQLGLPNEATDIERFAQQHKLDTGILLVDADFWDTGQADFIREQTKLDSDWVGLIDQLDVMLRR